MRTKTTLFLLVLVVALGAVAYYVHREKTIGPEEAFEGIVGPEAAALEYLRISFGEAAPITLEKLGQGWWLTEPVRWPANDYAVGRLLNQLQFLKRESSFAVTSQEALAGYGLAPPEGTLTYGIGDARRVLRIGRATDTGRNVYLLHEGGDRVLVFNRSIADDLHRKLEEFRSSNVFDLPAFEVRSWSVHESGKAATRLVREGEKWRLETPVQARADKAAVETLLNSLLVIEVKEFWQQGTPDLNALGLVSPAVRITLVGSGNRREALLLGREVDPAGQPRVYFGKREDNDQTIFQVSVPQIDQLRNAQTGLRDRHVVEFDPADLQSITIAAAGQPPVTLLRLDPTSSTSNAWQVIASSSDSGLATTDGDPAVISALVQEIKELRAVSEGGFVTDAPSAAQLEQDYGLGGEPAWRIELKFASGNAPAQVIKLGGRPTGAGGENQQYALADAGSVYRVDRALGDELSAAPHHYRNRQLRRMAAGELISSIVIRRLADSQPVFSVARSTFDQPWAEALAGETPARAEAATRLIAQLRNLRARAIVAPDFGSMVPGEAGNQPWTWKIETRVALEGGANTQTKDFNLYVNAFTGGNTLLIGVPELSLVASAEPAFLDAVRPLIFERADPGPVPPDAAPATASPPADVPANPAPANAGG